MASIRTNKLIPILAVIGLVCVAAVIFRARSTAPHAAAPQALTQVPTPKPSADADSPADTVRTLTETVNKTKEEVSKLRQDNDELKKRNDEIARNKASIEEEVTRRLTQQFSSPEASSSPVFSGLSARIEDVANKLDRYTQGAGAVGAPGPGTAGAGGIPAGLGFDSKSATPSVGGAQADPTASEVVWVEPLGSRTIIGPNGQPQVVRTAFAPSGQAANPAGNPAVVTNPGGVYGPGGTSAAAPAVDANGQVIPNAAPLPAGGENAKPAATPYFTINENATLIGSTAMTALVGRVPVSGKITDPMPFKVLIGRTNLAANGLEVPDDISGMVVSGIAIGDWGLSCSQGSIQSVTFIFNDGAVKTVSNRTNGAIATNTTSTGGGIASQQQIGWISDKRGAPCISGKRISNAPSYLSTTVGLKALEAGARAAASSQTTTSSNLLGGANTAVTGNQSQYVLGNVAAGGVSEISDWVRQRLTNSFDAIYTPPGVEVEVHIDRELQLDKAPDARKLDYGRVNAGKESTNAKLD